jgi:phosphatidylserine decarboxylase
LTTLKTNIQYLLPKKLLTQMAGWLADARAGFLTTWLIQRFIKQFDVDMSEAAISDPRQYATFNEFFTRKLKQGVRNFSKADWICPVDGAISQLGKIHHNQLLQAKEHHYSIDALLAGNQTQAKKFEEGSFATIYLSPKDYHRIHMPYHASLERMTYVPGDLFSVNPATAQSIPGLFARNERVICEFNSDQGAFLMILVGATIVGSIHTAWHGSVTPPRSGKIQDWEYTHKPAISLNQGDEMGKFMLGSTVIMLFPPNTIEFDSTWHAGKPVKLGEAMGQYRN